jgi:inner membrane protein
MSTVMAHGVTALALGKTVTPRPMALRFWFWAVLCACIPDADVLGFGLGIRYGDLFGHRGFTHSLTFALLLGISACWLAFRGERLGLVRRLAFSGFFFLVTASHGLLDAMTNGGLGVAFFSPFDTTRYFLPWRPLEVPPIGIAGMFSARGLQILANEGLWIELPALTLVTALTLWRRARPAVQASGAGG